MKIFKKLDRIMEFISKFCLKFALTGLLSIGGYNLLMLSGINPVTHIWYLISFAFVVGTFILSIRREYLNPGQEKVLPKISFWLILSSILMLISYGFSVAGTGGYFTHNLYLFIFVFLLYSGFILFYYSIAEFVIELFKIVWSKK